MEVPVGDGRHLLTSVAYFINEFLVHKNVTLSAIAKLRNKKRIGQEVKYVNNTDLVGPYLFRNFFHGVAGLIVANGYINLTYCCIKVTVPGLFCYLFVQPASQQCGQYLYSPIKNFT
jgi:hypothetical protein